jgi:hypothetical protein
VNVDGIGVRALSRESGVSAAYVTRYAAAALLSDALDTLKGARPDAATPARCLTLAREASRGGIGAKGIGAILADESLDTSAKVWHAATQGAKAAKAADAAKVDAAKGTPRVDDGGKGTEVDVTPWQAAALAVADAVRMVKAAAKVTPEPTGADAASMARARKGADGIARECDAVAAKIGAKVPSTVPTPAEVASNVGARA